MYRQKQVAKSDGTILFVRQFRKEMDNTKDFTLMSKLWLSQSRTALIYQYLPVNKRSNEDQAFERGFELFDTQAPKRKRQRSVSEAANRETNLNLWAAENDNAETLKLLHRLLRHIQHVSENEAKAGVSKFALRQIRKYKPELDIESKVESSHIIMDLVSPNMSHKLCNPAQDQADGEFDG